MKWDMHYLVADIARTITLNPGDVLLSGTPAGSRPVGPGDVVDVEVDGLGGLTSHVVAGPGPVPPDFGAQPTESEEVVSTALGGDWEFAASAPRTDPDPLWPPGAHRPRPPHKHQSQSTPALAVRFWPVAAGQKRTNNVIEH